MRSLWANLRWQSEEPNLPVDVASPAVFRVVSISPPSPMGGVRREEAEQSVRYDYFSRSVVVVGRK
jgi:hypothetical protein